MTDREKVLIGLECLITNSVECKGCPYNVENAYCITSIAQEAKNVIEKQKSEILEYIKGVAKLVMGNEILKNQISSLAKAVDQEHRANEYLNKQLAERQEIILCKDCRYHDAGENEVDAWNRCGFHHIDTDDNKFCSDGERR